MSDHKPLYPCYLHFRSRRFARYCEKILFMITSKVSSKDPAKYRIEVRPWEEQGKTDSQGPARANKLSGGLHSFFFFFYKNAYNLAEPEDVLILAHTFSLIRGQISASTFL